MANEVTEYQEEYCGQRRKAEEPKTIFPEINGDLIKQPVGGRPQQRAREAARARQAAAGTQNIYDPKGETYLDAALPMYDLKHITNSYKASQRGTHRVEPQWRDHRWSDETRIDSATLYDPQARDPPSRNNFNVYRTTIVDPRQTPTQPMAVPDVHRLRYMQNEYMTADDWY